MTSSVPQNLNKTGPQLGGGCVHCATKTSNSILLKSVIPPWDLFRETFIFCMQMSIAPVMTLYSEEDHCYKRSNSYIKYFDSEFWVH